MEPVKVFLIQPGGLFRPHIGVFFESEPKCSRGNCHYANVYLPDCPSSEDLPSIHNDDLPWPDTCIDCGAKRAADDPGSRTSGSTPIMVRADNGERVERTRVQYASAENTNAVAHSYPVGACWYADWVTSPELKGADGRTLVVQLPGGHDWMVDMRANNCTLPDDKIHKCWVRHGNVEDGTLHVDKNGNTCSAGAGSIQVPGFHGFLHHGILKDC